MNVLADSQLLKQLIKIIESSSPRPHHGNLLKAMGQGFPDFTFQTVFSSGGWHRAGGVIAADGSYLDSDLEHWLNAELGKCANDFGQFLDRYDDAAIRVTRHTGYTHYFTAALGTEPEDFLQLEVEELQEVLDRNLIDPDHPPADRQELLEPTNSIRLDAHPVGTPYYRFVRLVDARQVLARQSVPISGVSPLQRIMSEWKESRAGDRGQFCEHWVITGLEHYDTNSEALFTATLQSVHSRTLKPFHWDMTKGGVEMGTQIQGFDRAASYPGAWYFHFVASKLVPATLATVLKGDLDEGYHYLAERDLMLLKKFVANPYHAV